MKWVIDVAKMFSGRWFNAIGSEAEQVPATVAAIIFVWVSMLSVSGYAWTEYRKDRLEDEARFASVEQALNQNSLALYCSGQDRLISAKVREIERTERLIQKTDNDYELKNLQHELEELQRQLRNLEKNYETKCLNGSYPNA